MPQNFLKFEPAISYQLYILLDISGVGPGDAGDAAASLGKFI